MSEPERKRTSPWKSLFVRVAKATIKTLIIYLIFAWLSAFIISPQGFFSTPALFTTFFAIFLLLIFAIEFARGTVFQHIFSVANSLIVVFYFSYILSDSAMTLNIEQTSVAIDLWFFLSLFVLGGLLGLAKSMIQLIKWMNEREERWLDLHIKSL